jgi:hypothetical protein
MGRKKSKLVEMGGTEMFGRRVACFQYREAAVVLQVGDIYFVGWPDQEGNLVLPQHLVVANTRESAEAIAEELSERIGYEQGQIVKLLAAAQAGGAIEAIEASPSAGWQPDPEVIADMQATLDARHALDRASVPANVTPLRRRHAD